MEKARQHVALRLILFSQELAEVEPVRRRTHWIGKTRIQPQSPLIRLCRTADVALLLLQIREVHERQAFQRLLVGFLSKRSGGCEAFECVADVIHRGIRVGNFYERCEQRTFRGILFVARGDDSYVGAVMASGSLQLPLLIESLRDVKLRVGLCRVRVDGALPAVDSLFVVAQAMS